MSRFTLQQQIDCVAREIKMREIVYPGRVVAKKMKQEKADYEVGCMNAVLATVVGKQAIANSAPPPDENAAKLMQFYSVDTVSELIAAQARHVESLQSKLPPLRDTQPVRVREG